MMESKEVIVQVKNLEKSKTNDEVVLQILQALDKEVVPTEKLLRETKVGVEVNKFKKSNNPEIAKLVKKMITSWKDAINRSKKAKQPQQPQQQTQQQQPSQHASTEPKNTINSLQQNRETAETTASIPISTTTSSVIWLFEPCMMRLPRTASTHQNQSYKQPKLWKKRCTSSTTAMAAKRPTRTNIVSFILTSSQKTIRTSNIRLPAAMSHPSTWSIAILRS